LTKPAEYAIELYQGDSYDLYFRVSQRGVSGLMEYRDLTGSTVRGQIRPTKESSTVLATFVCTLADQGVNTGGVLIHLDPAVTKALSFTTAVYDIEIEFAATDISTVLAGPVTLLKEVTRA